MQRMTLVLGLVALVGLGACGDKTDGSDTGGSVSDDTGVDDTGADGECNTDNEECGPGSCWGEGQNMLPGSDCLACHTEGLMPEDDEPDKWWTVGGTLFVDGLGTDGESSGVVRVTDSEGTTVEMTTSSAGNFYSRKALVPPLSAEVEVDGEISTMTSTVSTGACNSCHRCDGAAGAKLHP